MSYRVAGTRADVDLLIDLLQGVYSPSRRKRIRAVAKAALSGIAFPLFLVFALEDDGSDPWLLPLLAGWAILIALYLLLRETATYIVAPAGFTRRNIIAAGSWTIAPSEVDTIELELAGDDEASFTIRTTTERKRSFILRKAAQQKLGTLYPELFSKTDYSQLTTEDRRTLAQFHGGFLRKSAMLLVASIAVIVLEVATSETRNFHWLAELVVQLFAAAALGGAALGVLGLAYSWFYKKAAEQAHGNTAALALRYRVLWFGTLAVVVIAVVVLMLVLNEMSLTTW